MSTSSYHKLKPKTELLPINPLQTLLILHIVVVLSLLRETLCIVFWPLNPKKNMKIENEIVSSNNTQRGYYVTR